MLKYGFTIYGLEFTPSEFFITDHGKIYVKNPEIGFLKHPVLNTENKLAKHVFNMVKDGFTIEPFTSDDLKRIAYKYYDVFAKDYIKGMEKGDII